MDFEDRYYIIGIDGGATKSFGVLFTDEGETLASKKCAGTNLTLFAEDAPKIISELISDLCLKAKIPITDVDAVGLGLAGASNQDGRELVFKTLDSLEISRCAIIASDAEAAYEVNCPNGIGYLITVSTGMICMIRTPDGKILRTGGLGHQQGDIGSGYWLGKKSLLHLAINEANVHGDRDMTELLSIILTIFEEKEFNQAVENVMSSELQVPLIASLAKPICELAEKGNDLALAIIQEGTQGVAEMIIDLTREAGFEGKNILLSGNGSVLRNDFYRKTLNDALRFDFTDIKWTFSSLSPAYGAGLLAGRLKDINVKLEDIIKRGAFASSVC